MASTANPRPGHRIKVRAERMAAEMLAESRTVVNAPGSGSLAKSRRTFRGDSFGYIGISNDQSSRWDYGQHGAADDAACTAGTAEKRRQLRCLRSPAIKEGQERLEDLRGRRVRGYDGAACSGVVHDRGNRRWTNKPSTNSGYKDSASRQRWRAIGYLTTPSIGPCAVTWMDTAVEWRQQWRAVEGSICANRSRWSLVD